MCYDLTTNMTLAYDTVQLFCIINKRYTEAINNICENSKIKYRFKGNKK